MLEIIASTVEDAIVIEKGGADRIELVSALSEGGLTPSYGLIFQVVRAVNIPVNVMVRPHSRGFDYSENDLLCMLEDIRQAKALGANGVVFGMLDVKGNIAAPQLEALLGHCQGLEVTFHRAIDQARDILAATELLATMPIDRVLSSGGPGQAETNVAVLRQMREILDKRGKKLMAGSGISPINCQPILWTTHAHELHVGTSVRCGFSAFENVNPAAVDAMAAAYNTAKGD
jgi:copper homeostasis protein